MNQVDNTEEYRSYSINGGGMEVPESKELVSEGEWDDFKDFKMERKEGGY